MSIVSFFSNLFTVATPALSAAGSAVGGFFSSFRIYLIIAAVVAVLTAVGGTVWYVQHLQSENQVLIANNARITDALNTETNSFNTLKQESDNLMKNYQDLQTQENQIQKQNDMLEQKFRNFDFGGNAIKNHDKTEKTINDQTEKMLKNFENLSDPNNLTSPADPVKITPPKKGK